MAETVIKTKSVNAYVDKYGHKFVVILLENGNKTFINEGLLAYACQRKYVIFYVLIFFYEVITLI